jgi:methyl-accepting chemotaxis protein
MAPIEVGCWEVPSMKQMTIWQRLNTALVLLILLLVACAGLALWVQQTYYGTFQRIDRLSSDKNRIDYDVILMSDALRGILLDPKSDPEKARRADAAAELASKIEDVRDLGFRQPELMSSVMSLRSFILEKGPGTLGEFQDRVIQLAKSDPAAATAYYQATFPSISRQHGQIFRELSAAIDQVGIVESRYAQTIALVGSICIVVLLLASIAVGFYQSTAIAQPLNRLVGALERMRQGDFTERLTLGRRDEFGVLGEGLNRLADDLSALVGQVQRSGIQVNTTATQIAAGANEQQSTAHEIAATTAQIGATSKEISATSKELVKTMNEVNQVAEETTNLAGNGQMAISRMEATMRQIIEASGSITAKLAVLSEKTANINSVVTTITKVADQTNLLSLNAAIEAEKAGEYGLGFAVVAMEIRRLADQTAVATYDIEKMVKEMQSAVAAGVMGMDKFSEEVRRGVEDVRQVSTLLAQIIHRVQTFTPRFRTVNEGMHAQATGAQQISETLTQLGEAAQQTAESLRQSNQAIAQLNSAAHGLETSVARFKLMAS